MRIIFLTLCWALSLRAEPFVEGIPESCRQVVCVTANDWKSTRGTLRRWERAADGPWRPAGPERTVMLGEGGLAWGLGRHRRPADAAPSKREGDRRAPAGVFALTGCFGTRAPSAWGRMAMPYRQLTADTEAVDDPASRFYNQIVRRASVKVPDWKSSERMHTIAEYELGVVVAHNPRNIPGAGSCIFIHQWREDRRGTAGCTVLQPADLAELVRWLDAGKRPVLIQGPRPVLGGVFREIRKAR